MDGERIGSANEQYNEAYNAWDDLASASREEHMENLGPQQHEATQDDEVEKERRKRELKEKFLLEDYGKYSRGNHTHLSYEATLSRCRDEQLMSYVDNTNRLRAYLSDSLLKILATFKDNDNLTPIEKNNLIMKQSLDALQEAHAISEETAKKSLEQHKAEWRIQDELAPYKIEKKYGNQVEEYDISLSDINRILVYSSYAERPSMVSNGLFLMPQEENAKAEPYEYFCNSLPNVIEKHFSDDVSEDHKQTISSIVKKIILCDDKNDYREFCIDNHSDELQSVPFEEPKLSENEIEFLARAYSDANKTAGNDRVFLDDLRGGTTTDDKLLDGIMYKLYRSSYNEKLAASEMGKKIKEYMQQD